MFLFLCFFVFFFFFFSSRRRHTSFLPVSWARRCVYGPIAGAIAFVLLETFLGGFNDRWQFFLGLVLLGVVLFARGGLIGLMTGNARHG